MYYLLIYNYLKIKQKERCLNDKYVKFKVTRSNNKVEVTSTYVKF